ncbi:MAG TPA: DUF3634 family protein [Sandaracinaceae bacterium LLY-WYZ-13_1]|nr:DUF3634 family protein [Sandaracinaceae bacterium LLY-WYZ-13_1]
MPLVLLVVVLLLVALAIVAVSRANEIFCVSIRDGRCLVIRGRVPPSLWRELREVVRIAGVRRGTVRAVKRGGQPALECEGLDDGTAQRLRNAFGAQGFGHLKASAPPAGVGGSRNLGQLLGIAWLAWLLTRR